MECDLEEYLADLQDTVSDEFCDDYALGVTGTSGTPVAHRDIANMTRAATERFITLNA